MDGVPPGVWLNLLLVAFGVVTILMVAASRSRLPAISTAPRIISKAVLGYTLAATIWTSIAVPLLPAEVITSAALDHGLMGLAVLGAVAVSIASWNRPLTTSPGEASMSVCEAAYDPAGP